jgi:hypothetical protein
LFCELLSLREFPALNFSLRTSTLIEDDFLQFVPREDPRPPSANNTAARSSSAEEMVKMPVPAPQGAAQQELSKTTPNAVAVRKYTLPLMRHETDVYSDDRC